MRQNKLLDGLADLPPVPERNQSIAVAARLAPGKPEAPGAHGKRWMQQDLGQVIDKRLTADRRDRCDLRLAGFQKMNVLRIESKAACGEKKRQAP